MGICIFMGLTPISGAHRDSLHLLFCSRVSILRKSYFQEQENIRKLSIRQGMDCHLLLYHLWTKNSFYIFNYCKKSENEKYFMTCDNMKFRFMSINEFLLGQSHVHVFMCCLWLLSFMLQWQSWVVAIETVWPTKQKIFTIWPFIEKVCWPNLKYVWVEQH